MAATAEDFDWGQVAKSVVSKSSAFDELNSSLELAKSRRISSGGAEP